MNHLLFMVKPVARWFPVTSRRLQDEVTSRRLQDAKNGVPTGSLIHQSLCTSSPTTSHWPPATDHSPSAACA